ncbi:hypothetical protein ACFQZ2_20840, partial [Streptomonospora algeriensis]
RAAVAAASIRPGARHREAGRADFPDTAAAAAGTGGTCRIRDQHPRQGDHREHDNQNHGADEDHDRENTDIVKPCASHGPRSQWRGLRSALQPEPDSGAGRDARPAPLSLLLPEPAAR